MTAWRQHEVVGRFYHDVLLPRDIQGNPLGYDHDPVVLAIETGKAVTDQQLILLARDGQTRRRLGHRGRGARRRGSR